MTGGPTFVSSRSRRRAERRRQRVRWLLGAAALLIAFGVGIALGEAIHDNPRPGGTTTSVRTLRPLPLPPQTVTVTSTR